MISFSLELPGRIVFGAGALERLPEMIPGRARRVLLAAGSGWFEKTGCARRVGELLSAFTLGRVACVPGEPTANTLERTRDEARDFSPDAIVGIGGGSVLDTAKALSVLISAPGKVEEYLEGTDGKLEITEAGLPWIAVPSTAGTGAEATKNAVVKSLAQGAKRSMRSRFLLAYSALVDPQLSRETPLTVSGTAGLDALTQLVEAYVSRKSNPPVRALVRGAFPSMLDALERIPGAPGNTELRSDAAYGALVSGIALTNAGLGAAHGFAAGIGGAHDIPHGLLCAVLLPHVLEFNSSEIADSIGVLLDGRCGKNDPVGWLSGRVTGLLRAYGLPTDLKSFGIPRESMQALARASSGSSMSGNPREIDEDARERLLSRVI
jgi:alcohol dehydrogenase class IV